MGYPKQPGQDAEAHLRLVYTCLAQAKTMRACLRHMEAIESIAPHERLDWAQAFVSVWIPRLRAALANGGAANHLSDLLCKERRGALEEAAKWVEDHISHGDADEIRALIDQHTERTPRSGNEDAER